MESFFFTPDRSKQEGLDEIDLEAMRDAEALRNFREFAMDRPATRAQMKRKVLRGAQGARDRKGLKDVSFTKS